MMAAQRQSRIRRNKARMWSSNLPMLGAEVEDANQSYGNRCGCRAKAKKGEIWNVSSRWARVLGPNRIRQTRTKLSETRREATGVSARLDQFFCAFGAG